jgi:hypothetical protein
MHNQFTREPPIIPLRDCSPEIQALFDNISAKRARLHLQASHGRRWGPWEAGNRPPLAHCCGHGAAAFERPA